MKKPVIIGIIAIAIIAIIASILIIKPFKKSEETQTKLDPINSAEDLSKLVDKIYEGEGNVLPSVQTQVIDVSDNEMVKHITGLENANDIEYLVVSEPMISSQAYSLILAKVKDGVNANNIAKSMQENVDTRKWICVTAEKVYATNSKNIVCLVMSSEKMAKPIYEKFKTLAGTVGQEYEKTQEEAELPEEMY